MLTLFGAVAVTLMMLFYALESRAAGFTLLFALSCLASSAYGWLAGTWPFGMIELIWGGIAVYKWRQRVRAQATAP